MTTRVHHFTMRYKGYDLVIDTPIMTIEQAELELRDTIEKHPEMEFVGKDWQTPPEMVG